MPSAYRSLDYKRTVWAIAAGTLLLAVLEAAWANAAGSPELLKDASGFGYDIGLNAVAAFVIGRSAQTERWSAFVIGALLLATGADGLSDLWADLHRSTASSMNDVFVSNLAAVVAAGFAAAALCRFRRDDNPLIKATWLNARNDACAAILTAVLSVVAHQSAARWPECALDLMSVLFSFQAASVVLMTAWRDMRLKAREGRQTGALQRD